MEPSFGCDLMQSLRRSLCRFDTDKQRRKESMCVGDSSHIWYYGTGLSMMRMLVFKLPWKQQNWIELGPSRALYYSLYTHINVCINCCCCYLCSLTFFYIPPLDVRVTMATNLICLQQIWQPTDSQIDRQILRLNWNECTKLLWELHDDYRRHYCLIIISTRSKIMYKQN